MKSNVAVYIERNIPYKNKKFYNIFADRKTAVFLFVNYDEYNNFLIIIHSTRELIPACFIHIANIFFCLKRHAYRQSWFVRHCSLCRCLQEESSPKALADEYCKRENISECFRNTLGDILEYPILNAEKKIGTGKIESIQRSLQRLEIESVLLQRKRSEELSAVSAELERI